MVQKETCNILADLISFQTDGTNINQHRACADYICNILSDNDVFFEKLKSPQKDIENIFAAINVENLKNIRTGLVLSGHYDVATANENLWKTPPYQAFRRNQKIYGRGTTDMKYFTAVVLSLLPELKAIGFPIFLLLTGDEETTVEGIKVLCNFMCQKQIHPQYALVGEPTNFAVCTSHNGYCGYQTKIYGVAAHSSRPELGVNAVFAAARLANQLEKLGLKYMSEGTTINVGLIRGGTQRNSVPDQAVTDWEIRFSKQKHYKEILKKLQKFEEQLLHQYPKACINTSVQEMLPAFEPVEGKLCAQALGLSGSSIIKMPLATEAGFLQQYGMETIVCGAGDDKLAHTSSEHISTDDIARYKNFLLKLIIELKNQGDRQ